MGFVIVHAPDCRGARIRAVSFDVTGTLVHCPRLGSIYAEILARHGIAVAAAEVEAVFPLVWQEFDCSVGYGTDRFATDPQGAAGWWRRFVERLCVLLGAAPPSPFAASELFDRFRRADAWEVYPEVRAVLSELRDAGYRLALLSNWDERLPALVEDLDLGVRFETTVYSARVGVEKPHPRIFEELGRELGLDPDRILHVGDRRVQDLEGATAAGLSAVRIRRSGSPGPLELADLSGLRWLLERSMREVDFRP